MLLRGNEARDVNDVRYEDGTNLIRDGAEPRKIDGTRDRVTRGLFSAFNIIAQTPRESCKRMDLARKVHGYMAPYASMSHSHPCNTISEAADDLSLRRLQNRSRCCQKESVTAASLFNQHQAHCTRQPGNTDDKEAKYNITGTVSLAHGAQGTATPFFCCCQSDWKVWSPGRPTPPSQTFFGMRI